MQIFRLLLLHFPKYSKRPRWFLRFYLSPIFPISSYYWFFVNLEFQFFYHIWRERHCHWKWQKKEWKKKQDREKRTTVPSWYFIILFYLIPVFLLLTKKQKKVSRLSRPPLRWSTPKLPILPTRFFFFFSFLFFFLKKF